MQTKTVSLRGMARFTYITEFITFANALIFKYNVGMFALRDTFSQYFYIAI